MKHYHDMTDAEFEEFLKTATADELGKAFCQGRTSKQIKKAIRQVEAIENMEVK